MCRWPVVSATNRCVDAFSRTMDWRADAVAHSGILALSGDVALDLGQRSYARRRQVAATCEHDARPLYRHAPEWHAWPKRDTVVGGQHGSAE